MIGPSLSPVLLYGDRPSKQRRQSPTRKRGKKILACASGFDGRGSSTGSIPHPDGAVASRLSLGDRQHRWHQLVRTKTEVPVESCRHCRGLQLAALSFDTKQPQSAAKKFRCAALMRNGVSLGMSQAAQVVADHYRRRALGDAILNALKDAGKDVEHLTPDDLAPVDEFHSGGRNATIRLSQLAEIDGSQRVLDVGCGIGGPSRYLASKFGCQVTGLDLTAEFVTLAGMLAQRTRLADKVRIRVTTAVPGKPVVAGIAAARQHIVATTDEDRADFLKKQGFSKPEAGRIIETVLREEGRPPESIFDFVKGITALARGREHQDGRLELEQRAKRLLDSAW